MPDPAAVPLIGIEDLERLAARTWRGLEEEPYGDWLLRAGGGFTGRANSVLVVGDPPAGATQDGLRAAVAEVTRWYSARGLRPRAQVPTAQVPSARVPSAQVPSAQVSSAQVSSPRAEAADAAFTDAGWTREEDVLVLTAPLAGRAAPAVAVELAAEPDDAWLAGYRYRGTPLPPVAPAVLLNAEDPVFAAVRVDPAPAPLAAVARGAVVEGWLCVTAVTVDERYRRRGMATAVMAGLGTWARERGAHSCLLQVSSANDPALALYARLGFTEHHRYHYRLGRPPESGPRPG